MSLVSWTLNKVKAILTQHLYILLIIPLFFIALPIAKPGIPITGDFPYSDTSDYATNRLWLWVEKGSTDGLESLSRFPIIGLWYLFSFINMDSGLATKIMVVLGFLLASFSFYLSFSLFFKNRGIQQNLQLKLSALLGAIFYAYNIWSFNRIHHWYLWISYAILPLFFISIYLSFRNPKNWKYVISSIFLWSFASTTPHMILFYGIIFLSTFLGFVLHNLHKGRRPITLLTPFLLIILFYSLVNMYWIYPYILSSQAQISIVNYEVTQESLKLLSREGNFLDTFRIMAYWLNSNIENSLESSPLYFFWVCLSFVVPVIAFSALILKKSIKYALIFSSVALIGIFLAMGTESQFDYHDLFLTIPSLSKFVWIFREADKWSFLITFAYSFLLGIVSYKIFSVTIKDKLYDNKKTMIAGFFIFFLILSICVTSYPFYEHHMKVLNPTILPSEFDGLNSFLSSIDTQRIFFMPYPMEETQWDKLGRVGSIYQLSSIKPSIESSQYNLIPRNYYNYLANSILDNRTDHIGNLIYPLGTSYLIFHNDTWSRIHGDYEPVNIHLLEKMYSLADLKNITNIGFYNVFQISNYKNGTSNNTNNSVGQVNIPSQNVAVIGGLEIYSSLSKLPSFNTLQSSLLFTSDIHSRDSNKPMRSIYQVISDRPLLADDFVLSLVDDKFITSPFGDTNRYDPSKVWSKSSTRDPDHAEFHPFLINLGIENWEFDYGKGLVMTKAMGEKLSVPIKIEKQNNSSNSDNDFFIFMRYLKNEKGGLMRIYLDNKLISEVNTSDRISNRFVWQKLGSLNLTEGKHELMLENVAGFNAVNILSVVPVDEFDKLKTETNHQFADKTQITYYLEAESNFYNTKGEDINSSRYLFEDNKNRNYYDNKYGTQSRTIHGSFKVPQNSDLVTLQFIYKRNDSISNLINDLEIIPSYEKNNIFNSDFEPKKNSTALAKLRQFDWMNFDKDIASTSLEKDSPIDGNNSLRVDLAESEKVGWNIISTDYIPIIDNTFYNATLDISAKDVKDLHSRILYFDLKKEEMSGATDFIFEERDGTFQDTFSSSILHPTGAKYLKYQILTKSDNTKNSIFLLDKVKLEEIVVPITVFKSKFKDNLEEDREVHNPLSVQNINYLGTEHKINSTHNILETKAFPVRENYMYNYTASVKGEDVPIRSVIADFRSSTDVIENSTRYGNNASNGRVLSLSPNSIIETTLEVPKSSNYSIAFRAKTCESCTFLRFEIDGNNYDESFIVFTNKSNSALRDTASGLQWIDSKTTYLKQGTYKFKIYSDSQADLDSVVLYSIDSTYNSTKINKKNHGTINLFDDLSSPALISGYEKINPTKHILSIKNATRPYIISFAESYDMLWTASSKSENEKNNDFRTNSIPIYGLTNGFYVNKTGDYNLVIEYEPQKWFVLGAIISIGSLILLSPLTIFLVKKKLFRVSNREIRKN